MLLVEQEDLPGVHSSGRNAAMVREWVEDPEIRALVGEGAGFLRRGTLAEFHRTGSVLLGLGDEDVSRRVPPAAGFGLWCPDDGVVDVNGLLHAYLRGQTIRYGTRVLKWRRAGDEIEVETSQGSIRTGLLVNAAGAWAGEIGDIPMTPMNRHLFFTPPVEVVDRNWPFVWDIPGGFYFRQESGGLLLCTCDEVPAAPGECRLDGVPVEQLAELTCKYLPGLDALSIKNSWVGQRTFAPDSKFVIGHDARCPLLFHVAGLGGHGVGASWSIGRLAAERILQGSTEPGAVFAPARLLESLTLRADREHHETGEANRAGLHSVEQL